MPEVVISLAAAAALIPDGARIMIGGFLGVGTPHRLIDEIVRQRRQRLTVIANDTGRPGIGIGKLIDAQLVTKLIVSHIGTNAETQRQMIASTINVELCPQGTLAERIRAGGYGLGGILTPTGLGTLAGKRKQVIELDGKAYLLERPIRANFALIGASRADYRGNTAYFLTGRNFNPLMAMAADTVIVEPAEIVPIGVIPPDEVVTPHVLVDYLVAKEHRLGQ